MPEDDIKIVGNLEIHNKERYVVVSVSPKIYPLDVIYSAAYVMLDKAYIILTGNPDEEVLVELRYQKSEGNLELLGREFNNELINYAVYKTQSEQSRGVKEEIVRKALQTNLEDSFEDSSEEEYLDDPLGIAVPWEEKHGKDNSSW